MAEENRLGGFNRRERGMSYNRSMTQPLSVRCKLKVPVEFRQEIDETLDSFADACNQILEVAKRENCWNTNKLHHKVYHAVRSSTGLKANHVCQAIRRVIGNAKAVKQIHRFRPSSIALDVRNARVSRRGTASRSNTEKRTGSI